MFQITFGNQITKLSRRAGELQHLDPTCIPSPLELPPNTHTHTHTHTHAQYLGCEPSRASTHARTHAHTHAHTHTQTQHITNSHNLT